MTTKDIKLRNIVDVEIQHGGYEEYAVTTIENRGSKNILAITLTSMAAEKGISKIITINFEPMKYVPVNKDGK